MSPEILLEQAKFSAIKVKTWKYRGFLSGGKNFCVNEFIKKTPEAKAKPFVKWVGGKRQLIKQLREIYLIPDKFDIEKNTYFEPFIGGGAVFLICNRFNQKFLI